MFVLNFRLTTVYTITIPQLGPHVLNCHRIDEVLHFYSELILLSFVEKYLVLYFESMGSGKRYQLLRMCYNRVYPSHRIGNFLISFLFHHRAYCPSKIFLPIFSKLFTYSLDKIRKTFRPLTYRWQCRNNYYALL